MSTQQRCAQLCRNGRTGAAGQWKPQLLTPSPLPPGVPCGPGRPLSPFSPCSPGGPIKPINPGWPCGNEGKCVTLCEEKTKTQRKASCDESSAATTFCQVIYVRITRDCKCRTSKVPQTKKQFKETKYTKEDQFKMKLPHVAIAKGLYCVLLNVSASIMSVCEHAVSTSCTT